MPDLTREELDAAYNGWLGVLCDLFPAVHWRPRRKGQLWLTWTNGPGPLTVAKYMPVGWAYDRRRTVGGVLAAMEADPDLFRVFDDSDELSVLFHVDLIGTEADAAVWDARARGHVQLTSTFGQARALLAGGGGVDGVDTIDRLVERAFPDLPVLIQQHGGVYHVEWTDGPTAEQMRAALPSRAVYANRFYSHDGAAALLADLPEQTRRNMRPAMLETWLSRTELPRHEHIGANLPIEGLKLLPQVAASALADDPDAHRYDRAVSQLNRAFPGSRFVVATTFYGPEIRWDDDRCAFPRGNEVCRVLGADAQYVTLARQGR